MHLTPSKLYDYLQCPHKVWRDVYGPQNEKITDPNGFVQMLWDKGIAHEKNVIDQIGEVTNLEKGSHEERHKQTLEAMKNKMPLIYQGVLMHENLLGIPDLLKLMPDGSYIPVDIKSGMALGGEDEEKGKEGKPKPHYAVQLALYSDLLQKSGYSKQKQGRIIDVRLNEVTYDLTLPQGPRKPQTYWELYKQTKQNTQILMDNKDQNQPAMSSKCKLCPWYKSCKKWCEASHDLSTLFYIGRRARDTINDDLHIYKTEELIDLDIENLLLQKKNDKQFLYRLGESKLTKFKRRANIYCNTKKPEVRSDFKFPDVQYELFFDIENDPTQEFVYLHGVYERTRNGKKQFHDFTATELTPEAEKDAWARFWKYIDSLPEDDFAVYYYSAHEKSTYKKMQKLYPDVISEEKVTEFFENENVIDLYNKIVLKDTDWPLGSYGLKTIAQYLGFEWRDEDPSGAASIEWFNKYIETKDPKDLERILIYNEDDCIATMVLKDALVKMMQ